MAIPSDPHPDTNDIAITQVRERSYNARLVALVEPQAGLRIFRVVPDAGVFPFIPGQYVSLGLGFWEPRLADADPDPPTLHSPTELCQRAYSISCSLLDADGTLRRPCEFSYLEFYVALIRHAEKRPPALTPRLFELKVADRLYVGRRAAGHYTLASVGPDQNVCFFATGTGEAPHNAMIAELLATGHRGQIVNAVCVRHIGDAAYREVHQQLARRYSNYHYVLLTTREPENVDPAHPHFVGKRYLQDAVSGGWLEGRTGIPLDPRHTHVYLCGSPAMIGVSRGRNEPEPGSMLDLLLGRGFVVDAPGRPGTVHFERYW